MKSLAETMETLLDFEKLKYCFECGICTASCPVAELIPEYYNPRILLHSLPLGEEKTLKSPELWLCAWCYRCYERCPQGVELPEIFQDVRKLAIEHGHLEGFDKALKIIRENIPLPASCGYVCFHPERAINNKQLLADAVQQPIFNYQDQKIEEQKSTATRGKKVAIIGSGPSGLSAAYELVKKGYPVTVFESLPKAGGMLRVGIPEYRLPRSVLDADIKHIKDLGVEIRTNVLIGRDLMLNELTKEYDAVLIATGMHKGKKLGIEGEDLKGVVNAIDFLREVHLGNKIELGSKVGIVCVHRLLAIDAARVALRLGPQEVNVIYRKSRKNMLYHKRIGEQMQKEIEEAEGEGAKTHYMVWPTKILGKSGRVVGIECARMMLGEPDKGGKRRWIPIEGSEFIMELDSIILAVGQAPDFLPFGDVELTEKKTVEVDPVTLETSLSGVFAGGEVESGPSTAIVSIAAGKRAAVSIDSYLRGQPLESTKILENLRRSMNGNPST